MLSADDRYLPLALVRPDWAVEVTRFAGSGDHGFTPSAQCLAAKIAEAADLQRYRSISVCQPLSSRAANAQGTEDFAARDGHPLASGGLPELLALEVTAARRSSTGPGGDPPNHSGNEFGQSYPFRKLHPARIGAPG